MKGISMKMIVLLCLPLFLMACATKWKPQSSNPIAGNENTLKTDWGSIELKYYGSDSGGAGEIFDITLKNESDKPVRYERSYVHLISGDHKVGDIQGSILGKNVTKSLTQGGKGNVSMMAAGLVKSMWQGAKALGNGDIAPGSTHTDRLIFTPKVLKWNDFDAVFSSELVKDTEKNKIRFAE